MHLIASLVSAFALTGTLSIAAPISGTASSTSTTSGTPGCVIRRVIAIGDSLSDDGNLHALTEGALPPASLYWQGRFSNGPVWVEYIAEAFKANFYDYAYGSATVDNTTMAAMSGTTYLPGVPGGLQQVDDVIADADLMRHAKNTLVTFWIGANNYINAARLNITDASSTIIPPFKASLNKLKTAGFTNYVIPKLPSANAAYVAHNAFIDSITTEFKNSCTDCAIFVLDVDASLAKLPALGISNFTAGCVNLKVSPPTRCAASDEGKYGLWDGTHPSSKVHKQLANDTISGLKALGFRGP
ncbi:hypothetical protein HDV00_003551 [Rhizophlyctis rosea]|nr:hypothetical protein HDV00_003551 [Rhizophlyctis rosea]